MGRTGSLCGETDKTRGYPVGRTGYTTTSYQLDFNQFRWLTPQLTSAVFARHVLLTIAYEGAMDGSEAASKVHRLVLIHGRERAREMVPEKQRPLVDIAAEVMADESQRIGISYTGFCLTSLPHKRLPDNQTWEKKGHRVTLWVEPGRMKSRGKVLMHGVPYGARARMICSISRPRP